MIDYSKKASEFFALMRIKKIGLKKAIPFMVTCLSSNNLKTTDEL